MIQRPCTQPGCPAYALPRSSRCEQHQRPPQPPPARDPVRIRNSRRWQVTRAAHAASNPVCCDPFRQHLDGPEPTESIHHVFPLDTHPELAFVESNLRSLCNACHSRIEQLERSGNPTQGYFET